MSQAVRNTIQDSAAASATRETEAPPRAATSLPDLLEGEEARAFAELHRALEARFAPADEVERLVVEAMAAAFWRQRRLDLIEERVLAALASGRPLDGLPSLATLARCRARIARDLEAAEARLAQLKSQRARWSADLDQALSALEDLAAALGEAPPVPEAEPAQPTPAVRARTPSTDARAAGAAAWGAAPVPSASKGSACEAAIGDPRAAAAGRPSPRAQALAA